eukprot:scaffold11027_cov73-Skeletonema_marinoi.AAC.1
MHAPPMPMSSYHRYISKQSSLEAGGDTSAVIVSIEKNINNDEYRRRKAFSTKNNSNSSSATSNAQVKGKQPSSSKHTITD